MRGNSNTRIAWVARCAFVVHGRPILVSYIPTSVVHVRPSLFLLRIDQRNHIPYLLGRHHLILSSCQRSTRERYQRLVVVVTLEEEEEQEGEEEGEEDGEEERRR